jgi:hypothetical protein
MRLNLLKISGTLVRTFGLLASLEKYQQLKQTY